MKYTGFIFMLLLFSCSVKTEEQKETKDSLAVKTPEDPVFRNTTFGSIRIESTIRGKGDPDFWETGLKEIQYKVIRHDSILTTIDIKPEDFESSYTGDFGVRSKIWESEILAVDANNQKIVIANTFGFPETDILTTALVIADFRGNKSYKDSPFDCASGTTFSYNKIVDCSGVYDFDKPILEFYVCCTVFSDLVNNSTLFYVRDRNSQKDEKDLTKNNAFFIDINTKDTLDSFIFKDFTEAIGYSALIELDKKMGVLSVLDLEAKTLTTWDTLLTKQIFDLSRIESVSGLKPDEGFLRMSNEDSPTVIIELDNKHRPIRWNQ